MAKWVVIISWVIWIVVTIVMLFPSNPPFLSIMPPDQAPIFALRDAIGHLILFTVLGFLNVLAIRKVKGTMLPKTTLAAALVLGIAWGACTEWYQTTSPLRDGSLEDLGINAAGVAIGVVKAWGFLALIGKRRCLS